MPKSSKRPARRGTKKGFSETIKPEKRGFDPKLSRLPNGLNNKASKGGKPMLFPGRTGGR